jgi:DNA-binding NarL/FixJ family response regulator
LSREAPDVGVVFLTNLPDPRFAKKDAKAVKQSQAYLRKSQLVDSKELVDAVNAVLKEEDVSKFRHDQAAGRPLAKLSKRQLVVLQLMADGLSNSQIADERGTTLRAVEGMISRIFQALEIDAHGAGNARITASKAYLGAVGAVASDQ